MTDQGVAEADHQFTPLNTADQDFYNKQEVDQTVIRLAESSNTC